MSGTTDASEVENTKSLETQTGKGKGKGKG